jgi:uncharacterized NAD(P)/FAD-binding protein YdhS
VLIVGNGLTMADVAFALSRHPTRAPILHTLSRRGLTPQVQTSFHPSSACGRGEELLVAAHSIRSLLKTSRQMAQQSRARRRRLAGSGDLDPKPRPRSYGKNCRCLSKRGFYAMFKLSGIRIGIGCRPQLAERLAQLKSSGRLRINAGRVQQVSAAGRPAAGALAAGEAAHDTSSLDVDYDRECNRSGLRAVAEPGSRCCVRCRPGGLISGGCAQFGYQHRSVQAHASMRAASLPPIFLPGTDATCRSLGGNGSHRTCVITLSGLAVTADDLACGRAFERGPHAGSSF